jgi:asparagine synthase (glutamine-hydrolysing)
MCGIVGIVNLADAEPVGEGIIRQMLALIRHRGPDQFGIYLDEVAALGSARLSIIDLSSGQQPICNEDGSLWIVFNGEIFNYLELREELVARGHCFATQTDTEVILHAYEEFGTDCLRRFNGQFAFAIWDARQRSLFLARDRVGVRPLFYASAGGALVFGSEIKALLADRRVRAEIDPVALDQIFTLWSTVSPRTVFRGVAEIPPGHFLLARGGTMKLQCYWQVDFLSAEEQGRKEFATRSEADYLEEFRDLLVDATQIRLRADVPVGAYLSGGIDSSTIAAVIRRHTASHLDTFSIAFSDPRFDESEFQRRMAKFLGTAHQVVFATHADIGRSFPEVTWHTETPLLRTAPVPMFLLSRLVRDRGLKVVLTGEGADEFLAGYDVFKEAKVRQFCARQPASRRRPLLFKRLYPDIAELSGNTGSFLSAFFSGDPAAPDFSHAVRWKNSGRTRRFFSQDVVAAAEKDGSGGSRAIGYPEGFLRWGTLERGQYLESTIFLSQYLLSSQGDRVAMAHSVEGRYPFLDYRLMEFCNRLPSRLKLRGLKEKYLLRRLAREWLPEEIWKRPKRPYRAPIHRSFFNEAKLDYVQELLAPENVKAAGLFKASAVSQLVKKIQQGPSIGETDDMALAGILSTQLVHHQFVTHYSMPPPLAEQDDVKVCRSPGVQGCST